MATQFIEGHPPTREVRSLEVGGASSLGEALGAVGVIVLGILGLAGVMPVAMMTVGTIVLGAAILLQAGAIGARYRRLLQDATGTEGRTVHAEVTGGMSANVLAGITGVVLGILAMLRVLHSATLCSIALIAYGSAMLLGSAAVARFRSVTSGPGISDTTRRFLDDALAFSASSEVLLGTAAVVMGILALLGISSVTLVLVGLLALGFGALAGGSSLGVRMLGVLRHAR
jgi:hypothetical protein